MSAPCVRGLFGRRSILGAYGVHTFSTAETHRAPHASIGNPNSERA